MTEPRESILDKSFRQEGTYFLALKSGIKIAFYKRSEVWTDKAKCQFVTLELLHPCREVVELQDYVIDEGILSTRSKENRYADVRYNDISCVWGW